jgi:tetratricopeptide (TPR) repeat protein
LKIQEKNVNKFKIKRKRERNQIVIVRFLLFYLIILGALLTLRVWSRGMVFNFKDVMVFSLWAMPLCALMVYVVEKFGSGLGRFLSGWSSKRPTTRETLAADLEKARYSKREGRFHEALTIIDDVLDKDPNLPDALFLKAQILWKGFGNAGTTEECLRKVMQLTPKGETLHRWALSFYDEVSGMKRKQGA